MTIRKILDFEWGGIYINIYMCMYEGIVECFFSFSGGGYVDY
jgi:hypothetical protein